MSKFKKINNFKKLFISIILIFVFIISLQNSFAADVNINNATLGGINGAVASASDGDNIVLSPGTYNKINQDFNIAIGKNVTIRGNGPTDSVIIDAQNQSRIFIINNGMNVTFINITFINGKAASGGAIQNNAMTTFINCTFINNTASGYGGAIYNNGGSANLTGCIFTENSASYGGAIHNYYFAILTVNNCIFAENSAINYGGAIHNYYSAILTVNNCIFAENSAGYGGAIYNNGDSAILTVNSSIFTENSAYCGGAICNMFGSATLTGCNFVKNSASEAGAIYNYGSPIFTVNNCIFAENSAIEAGAIYHLGFTILTVNNCTFTENTARYGGAIYNYGSAILTVNNSIFAENSAIYYGAAVYNHYGYFNLSGSNFMNNDAAYGGAVYNYYGYFNLSGSNFVNNTAVSGGAVYNHYGNFTLSGSNFVNNIVTNYGGGIYNLGNMSVSGNSMVDNVADLGGNMIYNLGNMGILTLTFIDNSTIFVNNSQTIVLFANLTDDMGNTVTGQNISFFVNGTLVGNVTSVEGYANISYNVTNLGMVPVTGDYGGHNGYSINIFNGQLTSKIATNSTIVVPNDVKNGETIFISGVVVDENGDPVVNVVVDVVVGGQLYSLTTDGFGFWSLFYTPSSVGYVIVLVNWTGDGSYFGFVNNTGFNVVNGTNVIPLITNSTIVVSGDNNWGDNSSGIINTVDSVDDDSSGIASAVDSVDNDDSFDVVVDGGDEELDDDDSVLGYAAMKKTGMPIIAIIIILLSIGLLGVFRKKISNNFLSINLIF